MKISLIGYGRMGHMIEEIALERGHTVSCIIDIDNLSDIHSEAFRNSDVAIEFTTPTAAYANICAAFAEGVKVVSGSTGWRKDHEADIQRLIDQGNTLFWASNFSLGVALFAAVNRRLAQLMDPYPDYDVSMKEIHHIHKADAPSGTAITLANDIIANLNRKDDWMLHCYEKADGTTMLFEPMGPEQLLIDAVRKGEVPGTHSVTYRSEADEITITHRAFNRRGFALGAVIAAEFTATHTGLLTTSDLFSL